MKKYYIAILIVLLTVIVLIIFPITTKAITGKSVFEIFFNNTEDKKTDTWRELLKHCGEKAEHKGYIITLDSYIYDSSTNTFYCEILIEREDGLTKGLEEYVGGGLTFGEDAEFTMYPGSGGSGGRWRNELIGNVFHIYFRFAVSDPNEQASIFFFDDPDSLRFAQFYFEDTMQENVMTFNLDSGEKVNISPISISVEIPANQSSEINDFVIHFKNGDTFVIAEDGGIIIGNSFSQRESYKKYTFVLKNMIDYRDITHIVYNGETYKAE